MRIRQLFQSTVHQPETLQVVFAAFDLAWAELESKRPTPEADREDERHRLATAMLSFVTENMTDPVELKDMTLAVYTRPKA
jgi:hypothetical protein